MTVEIKVPEVSEGTHQGIIVAISVAVGDQVEAGQTLLDLETDKAVVDIPSPESGKIKEIRVKEGDEVAVGAVIMLIEAEGAQKKEAPKTRQAPPKPEKKPEPEPATEPEPGTPAAKNTQRTDEEPPLDLTPLRLGDRVAPAAPSIRRLARELGVDIYQVQGTGPGGRISEQDVRSYVHDTLQRITGGGREPMVAGEFPGLHAQRPLPDFTRWGKVTREPLSHIRELTADAMGYAWSTIPMVTQYDQAIIRNIENYRQNFNGQAGQELKLTLTAILVKICAAALKTHPRFNSSLDLASRELVLKHSVHIGVAVDTPAGLLVPVLRDADQKGIEKLASELEALAAKARERKISAEEMEGGTFTISNLGGIGGQAFTPLVYAPQAAILGVSRARMQPVWNGQTFTPEQILPLALSYDHRVIDGAEGARFLRWICEALQNPLQLLMKG